jgi:hypothetical protein
MCIRDSVGSEMCIRDSSRAPKLRTYPLELYEAVQTWLRLKKKLRFLINDLE